MVTSNTYRSRLASVARLSLVVIVAFLSSTAAQADSLKVSGTGSSIGPIKIVSAAFLETAPGIEIEVIEPAMGSGGSIKGVIGGFLDISLSARPLKDKEQAEGLTAEKIATTPFIIATAKANTGATGFSLKELAEIYTGKITTWPDGSRLRLILRPSKDSDTASLRKMSPDMAGAMTVAVAMKGIDFPATDQDAAEMIARVPGAMGSSSLALIISENRPLKPLAIDGIVPSVETMRKGAYPFAKPLYVVTGPKPSEATRRFIAFLTSERGREILSSAGYGPPMP